MKSPGQRFAAKQARRAQAAKAQAAAAAQRDAAALKRLANGMPVGILSGRTPSSTPQPVSAVAVPFTLVVCAFRHRYAVNSCGKKSHPDAEYCIKCGNNLPGRFSSERRHWICACGIHYRHEKKCNAADCGQFAPWIRMDRTG